MQLKPGARVEATELIERVKLKLGGVKAPKNLDFADELPRSPVGKVVKARLRERYWEGKARAIN